MRDYVHAMRWSDIAAFYADCTTRIPYTREMEALVRRIAESPLGEGAIHAATSHIDLVIAPRAHFEVGKDTLRLTPHPDGIAFEYRESASPSKVAWAKKVPAVEAFETLEQFVLDVARWHPR